MRSDQEKNIRSLHIYGDSELVIKCMMGENQAQNLILHILDRYSRDVATFFDNIYFEHIYIQYNTSAYAQSKASLSGLQSQVHEGLLMGMWYHHVASFLFFASDGDSFSEIVLKLQIVTQSCFVQAFITDLLRSLWVHGHWSI